MTKKKARKRAPTHKPSTAKAAKKSSTKAAKSNPNVDDVYRVLVKNKPATITDIEGRLCERKIELSRPQIRTALGRLRDGKKVEMTGDRRNAAYVKVA